MHTELDDSDRANQKRFNDYIQSGNFAQLFEELKNYDYLYEYKFKFIGNSQIPNNPGMIPNIVTLPQPRVVSFPMNGSNRVINLPQQAQLHGNIPPAINPTNNVINTQNPYSGGNPGFPNQMAGMAKVGMQGPNPRTNNIVPTLQNQGGPAPGFFGGIKYGVNAPPAFGMNYGNNLQMGNRAPMGFLPNRPK